MFKLNFRFVFRYDKLSQRSTFPQISTHPLRIYPCFPLSPLIFLLVSPSHLVRASPAKMFIYAIRETIYNFPTWQSFKTPNWVRRRYSITYILCRRKFPERLERLRGAPGSWIENIFRRILVTFHGSEKFELWIPNKTQPEPTLLKLHLLFEETGSLPFRDPGGEGSPSRLLLLKNIVKWERFE